MSSVKLTNHQLDALCKENGLKGFSKLKKDEKVAKLIEAGVELPLAESTSPAKAKKSAEKSAGKKPVQGTAKEESKVEVKKATKPRVEKLDKKLVKFVDLNKYAEVFTDHKEDLTYAEVVKLLKEDIEAFVKEVDDKECAIFVDKFGALSAIKYQRSHKNSKLSSKDDAEIYKILLLDLFLNGEDVLSALFKAAVKLHAKLQKPPTEKKTKKPAKKVILVDAPEDDEEEDDIGCDQSEDEQAEQVEEVDEVEEDQTYIESEDEL